MHVNMLIVDLYMQSGKKKKVADQIEFELLCVINNENNSISFIVYNGHARYKYMIFNK